MRISLLKASSNDLGGILVHVQVSESDDPPRFFYSHSFRYLVPSGTGGEIVVYAKKTNKKGTPYPFELEKCHKKCKDEHNGSCPVIPGKNRVLTTHIFDTKPKGETLRLFGAALFYALFSGRAGQLLQKTKEPHPNSRISLQLNNHQELEAIPWEYAKYRDTFLVYERVFSRVLKCPHCPLPKRSMRIVAVVPDPIFPNSTFKLPDLNLNDQWQTFINRHSANRKNVLLERVFPPTVDQMDALLMNEPEMATILHFMGHCVLNEDEMALVFEHYETGEHELVSASRPNVPKNLRLAFLSACNTRDIAKVLCERGVPYTIGTNCSLPDDLARKFESKFYQLLAGGFTVETALWRARVSFRDQSEPRERDYLPGAMVLYSPTFSEDNGVFECKQGEPTIELHMPPNNLHSFPFSVTFCGRNRELIKLNSILKDMTNRNKQTHRVCTIIGGAGEGKTTLAMEAARRAAHLFPGGVFAWTFDDKENSEIDYFSHLVHAIFSKKIQQNLSSMIGKTDINDLSLAIIRELVGYPTCLLIIDNADILKHGESMNLPEAIILGNWLRKVTAMQNIAVKILATSHDQLGWPKEETFSLGNLADLDPRAARQLFVENLDLQVRKKVDNEGNRRLLSKLVKKLDSHPLDLVFLGRAASRSQHNEKTLEDIFRNCHAMLADEYSRDGKFKPIFGPIINDLQIQQRLLLYLCSLVNGPISEEVLLFLRVFAIFDTKSEEKIDFSADSIAKNFNQVVHSKLLSKIDNVYTIHVGLREGIRQHDNMLSLRLQLATGVYSESFIIGVAIPSEDENSKVPEKELRIIQSSASIGLNNKTLGIQFYSIGKEGIELANIPGTKNYSLENYAEEGAGKVIRLVVFGCEESETLREDFPLFCGKEIVQVVSKKRLPFILYLKHNDSFARHYIKKKALEQMENIRKHLHNDLNGTHWLIQTDVPVNKFPPIHMIKETQFSPIFANTMDPQQPPQFSVPAAKNSRLVGRDSIFLELWHQFRDRKDVGMCSCVALVGLGGTGKTQIALEYCYRNRNKYHYVFWLCANSATLINASFANLANTLKLEISDADPMKTIEMVKHWFERANKSWLLIFDDVEELNSQKIIDYFPKMGNGDILLTTRNAIFNYAASVINLDEKKWMMKIDNASELLLQHTSADQDVGSAQNIVNEFGLLPLAIDHVGKFINHRRLKLDQFLELYKSDRKRCLRLIGGSRLMNNEYEYTLLTVWNRSYEAIKRENQIAFELLRALSFFRPKNIPVEFFQKHLKLILLPNSPELEPEFRENEVDNAIHTLRTFSLVNLSIESRGDDKIMLSVQPLVQETLLFDIIDEKKLEWCHRLIIALCEEVGISQGGETYTKPGQTHHILDIYASHIRHIALRFKLSNFKELTSLLSVTVEFLATRANFENTEDLAIINLEGANGNKAMALSSLGVLYHAQGKYNEAKLRFNEAMKIQIKTLGLDHLDIAISLHNLTKLYISQGKYSQAEVLCEKALAIREKALGDNSLVTAESLDSLAELSYINGKYSEADFQYTQVLRIREIALGSKNPGISVSLKNLAKLYMSQGKYDASLQKYREALDIQMQTGTCNLDLATLLIDLAEIYCAKGKYVEAKPLYLTALDIHEKRLRSDHPNIAYSLRSLAWFYKHQGIYGKAESEFERALIICERLLGREHPDTAAILCDQGKLKKTQHKFKECVILTKKALEIFHKTLGPKHPKTIETSNNLGSYLITLGELAEAEVLCEKAVKYFEQVLGPMHPNTARSIYNLARLYFHQGKHKDAEKLYRQALTIREKVLGNEHPNIATSMYSLALLYFSQGKDADARRLYSDALKIRENVLGLEHPDTATSLYSLALLYVRQNKYADASQLYLDALRIREKVLGLEHPDTATSQYSLALHYVRQGKYEDASKLYLDALTIRKKVLGLEHPDTAISQYSLALLYVYQGKYEDASKLYLDALTIRKKVLELVHPDTAISQYSLALLYVHQGKYEDASKLYLDALAICKKVFGPEHSATATLQYSLVLLYVRQGKHEDANKLYLDALTIRKKVLGLEHPDTATSLYSLAKLKYEEALAIPENMLGSQHPDTATSLCSLALLYDFQSKYEEANLLYRRSEYQDTAALLKVLINLRNIRDRKDKPIDSCHFEHKDTQRKANIKISTRDEIQDTDSLLLKKQKKSLVSPSNNSELQERKTLELIWKTNLAVVSAGVAVCTIYLLWVKTKL